MPPEDILLCYYNVLILNNASRGVVKTCDAEKTLAPISTGICYTARKMCNLYYKVFIFNRVTNNDMDVTAPSYVHDTSRSQI